MELKYLYTKDNKQVCKATWYELGLKNQKTVEFENGVLKSGLGVYLVKPEWVDHMLSIGKARVWGA